MDRALKVEARAWDAILEREEDSIITRLDPRG
jgi:hypothetical protein